MAKQNKPQILWNQLTVQDITGIITHFATVERQYQQEAKTAQSSGMTSIFISSIPIVQSRQVFWRDMRARVQRGEHIASHVREYLKCNQ